MLLWWWYAVKSKTEKEIFLPRRKYRNLIDTVPQDEQLKPSPSAAAPVDNINTAAAEESKKPLRGDAHFVGRIDEDDARKRHHGPINGLILIPNPFLPHTPNAEENKNDGREKRAHERTKETHTEARSCQWYSLVRVRSITGWWWWHRCCC